MVLRTAMIVALVASITGCANNTIFYDPPTQVMSYDDLNLYKIDCMHEEEQRYFLKTQLDYIGPHVYSREWDMIKFKLHQLDIGCPRYRAIRAEQAKNEKTGCVNVREDMRSGSANATVCKIMNRQPLDPRGMRPIEPPVVNHWDPLVDLR
jgi:hypothetical protein